MRYNSSGSMWPEGWEPDEPGYDLPIDSPCDCPRGAHCQDCGGCTQCRYCECPPLLPLAPDYSEVPL